MSSAQTARTTRTSWRILGLWPSRERSNSSSSRRKRADTTCTPPTCPDCTPKATHPTRLWRTLAKRSSCTSKASAKTAARSTAASYATPFRFPRDRPAGRIRAQLIHAFERLGWETVRQRGSHVRLRHPDRRTSFVVPLHEELKRGTAARHPPRRRRHRRRAARQPLKAATARR